MTLTDQLSAALADRYIIERLIGEGGMATVYLARDVRHNRKVALKVLRPDLGAVLGVDRFLAEIEVTANLQHPNLLPLFDSGAAGELLFYVMPYVPGESLRARLDREKQLPVDEAVRLATAIAGALDYAHRQGVIHRDLKPENVLLQEGQPLVADFGIALAVSKAGGARVTQTGLSLGTPQYMSPEQATGDRVIDARADIYSLGALTYEMLAGEAPHTGTTAQAIIARLLTERPRAMRLARPAVPEHVEATVERALEKLPADRWASAREFAEGLSGARPVVRTTAAAGADGTAQSGAGARRGLGRRELAAWGAVAALAATSAWLLVGRTPAEAPPRTVEFEIAKPDSMVLGGVSSASIAITPDGRTVVFQGAYPSGARMLFVRSLGERTVRPIAGSEGATFASVSPDGSEVLFADLSGTNPKLVRLPTIGGTARPFAATGNGNGQVSWGVDGRVLFAIDAEIWIKGANEANATRVLKPDTAHGLIRYGFPHWLPGQRAALISVWRGQGADSLFIGVLSMDDRKVTVLDILGRHPRYSGTGHLLYVSLEGSLMAVPFDARSARVTGSPVVLQAGVEVGGRGAAGYDVARDGTLVMYVNGQSGDAINKLAAVSRDGHVRDLGLPAGVYYRPRVSPAGAQVTFVETQSRSNFDASDVWRAELSPPSLSRITTSRRAERPVFFRDGRRILFSSNPQGPVAYEVGLEAGSVARERFRWSANIATGDLGPPGGYAVFAVYQQAGNTDLWIAHMDSLDHPRPFAAEAYDEGLPRVSPDGRHVAYYSTRTGKREIYIRQLPSGGEEAHVSLGGGTDPVWGPNGRELFYRTPDSLYVADLDVGARVTVRARRAMFAISPSLIVSASNGSYDILPSGREFVWFARALAATKDASPILVRMDWARGLSSKRTESP